MPATFTVGATAAIFRGIIAGSQDEAGDLERVSLQIFWDTDADWSTLFTLVTTKYHVHVPVSGADLVIDVARGPGEGVLDVPGLMSAHALLVALRRNRWLPADQRMGQADFLVTSIP